ncbi:MarR family transcriptional regulator [Bacillus subtilis]|nr:MarR family transcriptional regulator [Bacillus subtilis]
MNSTILRILSEQGLKKSLEFAPILEVSASHITAVTDALVEKEWITRIRSKEDRRIIRIHITEAGEKVLQHFNEKKNGIFL